MPFIDSLGYFAAILTSTSFAPQAWHTFKTRDVRGISLGMYSAFTAGVACWLVYGLLLGAWPIVVANAVTLALAAAILAMKLRYRQGARFANAARGACESKASQTCFGRIKHGHQESSKPSYPVPEGNQ